MKRAYEKFGETDRQNCVCGDIIICILNVCITCVLANIFLMRPAANEIEI